MSEKKSEKKTEGKSQEKIEEKVEKKGTPGNFVFGLIGLVLGFVVGFMLTTSFNQTQTKTGSTGIPGSVKGDEKLPEGHPDVSNADIEKEVQAAVEFGKQNQDYASQLRVGTFLYVEARRLNEAKPYILKAHELKPEEFEPLMQLGNIAFDLSQESKNPKLMEEAGEWYQKALKIKPDDINVRTDFGVTYQLREPPNYKAALEQFAITLASEPKHPPTLYNKAKALLGMKDFKAADETFALLKQVSPQPELIESLQTEFDKAKGTTGKTAIPATGTDKPKETDEAVKIPTH